jgi:penicillin amidase
VVASANDRPPDGAVPAGYFFSPQDRVRRIRALLGGRGRLGLDDLAALQRDVLVPGMLVIRDRLLARIGARDGAGVRALAGWRGGYEADSRGALAYEVLLAELAHRLGRRGGLPQVSAVWTARALLADALLATPDRRLQPALDGALRATDRALRRWRTWGGLHRMRLRHQLAAVPLLGRRFRFSDTPSPGGNDTLDKTGHGPARGRHGVTYGASARFLADTADPDATRVVLLGGQDGWLGSDTFVDQAPLWREGRTIDLPLRPEAARAWPHHTVFRPG